MAPNTIKELIIKISEQKNTPIFKYKNELEGNLILTEESKEYINSILNNIKTKSNKKLNVLHRKTDLNLMITLN